MSKNRQGKAAPTQLIIQALSAAEASITLAKQLLSAQSGLPLPATPPGARPHSASWRTTPPSSRDLPGIVGKFDGEKMVAADGKTYPVPTNYAGKSKLVYGDTLKRLDNPDGSHLFKQIEKVARKRVVGKLEKKGEQWWVVNREGEYKVLNSNVNFLGGQAGDETFGLLPENDPKAPWAAIDAIPVRDAERRARRTEGGAVTAPAKRAEGGPTLVGKLLEKVTGKTEKKEKGAKAKEEKPVRKGRRTPAKAEAKAETKTDAPPPLSGAKGTLSVPPPPPVEDEGELR